MRNHVYQSPAVVFPSNNSNKNNNNNNTTINSNNNKKLQLYKKNQKIWYLNKNSNNSKPINGKVIVYHSIDDVYTIFLKIYLLLVQI